MALLGQVSPKRLDELAVDESFLGRLDGLAAELDDYLGRPLWYQDRAAEGAEMPNGIAYFSMEFGVAEVLPNYSGGLGILAGDHLKSASDLGLPLIAVGLYYRSGYFRQSLTADGWQKENYPSLDPQGLPLRLLTDREGDPVLVELAMPDCRPAAGPGVGRAGRSNSVAAAWTPTSRRTSTSCAVSPTGCTAATRSTGSSRRSWPVSAACGRSGPSPTIEGLPTPEVFHMNEGHAGFLGVERIRELIDSGLDFDTALTVVRSSTVFTTHTPVAAGIDRFPVEMVKRYFGSGEGGPSGATSRLLPGVPLDRIIAFGAEDDPSKFNMAHMGLRLAQRANGVSLLHGRVSREMFNELWPGFDPAEVPIGSITNGVHAPTWAAPQWLELGRELFGGELPSGPAVWEPDVWQRLQQVDPGSCGGFGRSFASSWSTTSGSGCAGPGWSVVHLMPNWVGSQRLSIRMC